MKFNVLLLSISTLLGVAKMAFSAHPHSHIHKHSHSMKDSKGKMDKRNIFDNFNFDSNGRHVISEVFSPLKDGLSRTSHWIDKDGFDCYEITTSFGKGIDHEKMLKGDDEGEKKDDGLFRIQKRGFGGEGEGEIDFVVDDGILDEELEDPFDF